MHGLTYDEIHDEFTVPQQFTQAILTFAGGAEGETAPLRVIQGSRTRLEAPDRVAVDAVNNEIFVPEGDKVLVFDRMANGNVAPKRAIEGPDVGRGMDALAIDPVNDLLIVGVGGQRLLSWSVELRQQQQRRKAVMDDRRTEGNFPNAARRYSRREKQEHHRQ